MPLNFLGTVFAEGTQAIPYINEIKKYGPYLVAIAASKRYFSGSSNTWEREFHGRVVMITGGTSGLGAAVAKNLAQRGAQVILLVRSTNDEWLANYIDDLRESTGNFMIYAEECNLSDFYSIRKFATTWLDNSPPRRLDSIICCAGVALPPSLPRVACPNGIEQHIQINYLSHYHLLTLLSPAFRAQPPDRDVRIILTACVSSVMADFDANDLEFSKRGYPSYRPWLVLGASKLALTMFGYEFQKRLNTYERPDKAPSNIYVAVVDPGMMRSPSFKRFMSFGAIWGLLLYLLLWPIWWLFLKTSIDGSQSILYAAMCPDVTDSKEVSYISECRIRNKPPRKELDDQELQKDLYDFTEKIVLDVEKKKVAEVKRREQKDKDQKGAEKRAAEVSTIASKKSKVKSKKT